MGWGLPSGPLLLPLPFAAIFRFLSTQRWCLGAVEGSELLSQLSQSGYGCAHKFFVDTWHACMRESSFRCSEVLVATILDAVLRGDFTQSR